MSDSENSKSKAIKIIIAILVIGTLPILFFFIDFSPITNQDIDQMLVSPEFRELTEIENEAMECDTNNNTEVCMEKMNLMEKVIELKQKLKESFKFCITVEKQTEEYCRNFIKSEFENFKSQHLLN